MNSKNYYKRAENVMRRYELEDTFKKFNNPIKACFSNQKKGFQIKHAGLLNTIPFLFKIQF